MRATIAALHAAEAEYETALRTEQAFRLMAEGLHAAQLRAKGGGAL
jgi:hypothetical protein